MKCQNINIKALYSIDSRDSFKMQYQNSRTINTTTAYQKTLSTFKPRLISDSFGGDFDKFLHFLKLQSFS